MAESAKEEKERATGLSMGGLLRYYDGETFDKFSLLSKEKTNLPGSWWENTVHMGKGALTKSLSKPLESSTVFCRCSRHPTYHTDIL